ncbi:HD domain-containing phosphohydrolase [Vibrio sp. AND4]|uniref:HD-GYP domain-containing protein n=1 Tax=Vibrio sp. AND4 TaxID=314289 RepID=UPI00015EFA7E|nr:HD domain-containing phosphohydrolase [Vibrio sp. AND4]EDP60138.1 response regulator receiver modulated metal dependent phosphohydrolase [Vibrio sp. AND4]
MKKTNFDLVYQISSRYSHSKFALALLSKMADHSEETYNHVMNVSLYAYSFALFIGLSKYDTELLFNSALVHDLGKLNTPLSILHSKKKLSQAERRIMNKHVQSTLPIGEQYPGLKSALEVGLLHHERWDGTGYPNQLEGNDIPFCAQILAIIDTWDAMTANRSYRKGMCREQALSILSNEKMSGQFNPDLVDEFIAYIRSDYSLPNSSPEFF